jgi:hypothetical protein
VLARIVRYILLGGFVVGVVFGLRWVWGRLRRRRDRRQDRAATARREPRFAEAVELQTRIGDLAAQHDLGLRSERELLDEVEGIVAALERLARLRVDLSRHLDGLDLDGRGATTEDAARIAEQRAKVARLREHERRLGDELERAVTELRQLLLDLLEGVSIASLDGPGATRRAQTLALEVQAQVEAEVEVQQALAEV